VILADVRLKGQQYLFFGHQRLLSDGSTGSFGDLSCFSERFELQSVFMGQILEVQC
jgi:hypothetical protein